MRSWPQTQREELRRRRAVRSVLLINGAIVAGSGALLVIVFGGLASAEARRTGSWAPIASWQLLSVLGLGALSFAGGVVMRRRGARMDATTPNAGLPSEAELSPDDPRRRLSRTRRSLVGGGVTVFMLLGILGCFRLGMALEPEWLGGVVGYAGAALVGVAGLTLHRRWAG